MLAGSYCPFCLRELLRVIATGFEYCPGKGECEYEVTGQPGSMPPLPLNEKLRRQLGKNRENMAIYQKRLDELRNECADLEQELEAVEAAGVDRLP